MHFKRNAAPSIVYRSSVLPNRSRNNEIHYVSLRRGKRALASGDVKLANTRLHYVLLMFSAHIHVTSLKSRIVLQFARKIAACDSPPPSRVSPSSLSVWGLGPTLMGALYQNYRQTFYADVIWNVHNLIYSKIKLILKFFTTFSHFHIIFLLVFTFEVHTKS